MVNAVITEIAAFLVELQSSFFQRGDRIYAFTNFTTTLRPAGRDRTGMALDAAFEHITRSRRDSLRMDIPAPTRQ